MLADHLSTDEQCMEFVIKRKRKRHGVDPHLVGFNVHPSSEDIAAFTTYASPAQPLDAFKPPINHLSLPVPVNNAAINTRNKNPQSGFEPINTTTMPHNDNIVTVEQFLRSNNVRSKRRRVCLDKNNHPSPLYTDEMSTSDISGILSFSGSRKRMGISARPASAGVWKGKTVRRPKSKLFTDRLVRAAILSHVDTDLDFLDKAEAFHFPPLKFVTTNGLYSPVRKPQRWRFADPKDKLAPFRHEFSLTRQESQETSDPCRKPVTCWRPLLKSACGNIVQRHKSKRSPRGCETSQQTKYPPLRFVPIDAVEVLVSNTTKCTPTSILKGSIQDREYSLAPISVNLVTSDDSVSGPPAKRVRFSSPIPPEQVTEHLMDHRALRGISEEIDNTWSELPIVSELSDMTSLTSPVTHFMNCSNLPASQPCSSVLPPIAVLSELKSSFTATDHSDENIDQLASSPLDSANSLKSENINCKKPLKTLGTFLDQFMETARQATQLEESVSCSEAKISQREYSWKQIDVPTRKCSDANASSFSTRLSAAGNELHLRPSLSQNRPLRPLTSLSFTASSASDKRPRRHISHPLKLSKSQILCSAPSEPKVAPGFRRLKTDRRRSVNSVAASQKIASCLEPVTSRSSSRRSSTAKGKKDATNIHGGGGNEYDWNSGLDSSRLGALDFFAGL